MGLMESIAASVERLEAKVDALGAAEPVASNTDVAGPRWLDPKSAAKHLGMSHQSLALYRSKGEGGPVYTKIGGTIRYDRNDLDLWMTDNKRM